MPALGRTLSSEPDELSASRAKALAEHDATRAAYDGAIAPALADAPREVHVVRHDANGEPAFVMFTKGAAKVVDPGVGKGPTSEIIRKIASASPAGFEPALQP